jgi:GGDEF domain-containing protein
MIINKEALDNSDFMIYSNEEIREEEYINEIDKLIEKYDINANNDELIQSDENKFIAIVNYSSNLYYQNKELPDDLRIIFLKNYPFKNSINTHLEKKVQNLIKNDSAYFFKEITTLIHLLCLGQNYEIFNSYNSYNYDAISELFRFYEDTLREQKDDKELFDTTFQSYIILLSAYTQLCVINATDIIRKKSINKVLDLMIETINMLKFSLALEEKDMNKINNVLGEHLYYFSHLSYITINKNDINYSLKEYYLYLEKQTDGYQLSKSSDFGGKALPSKNEEFVIFKNNASFLLLTLLQKLDASFKDYDYYSNKNFQKILELYYENFSLKTKEIYIPKDVKEFKNKLLNSLLYNYYTTSNEILTYTSIIDNFILEGSSFCNTNLETLHNILLFADDIDDYKYINVAQILVNTTSIHNDYHEYFKLKTFDVIINYFIKRNNTNELNELFTKIYTYVTINKTASHLLSAYSKIYLSLGLYYSYFIDEKELIQEGKTFYAIFIQTNGMETLKNQYKYINSKLLVNFGKHYQKELKLEDVKLSNDMYINLSKDLIKQYLMNRELALKFEINHGITKITNEIYKNPKLKYKDIHKVLVDLISNKVFHGLCQVHITGLEDEEISFFDTGYKKHTIKMDDKYSLLFIFPTIYEENFKYILNYNKDFIKNNIENILIALKEHIANYIDENTKLFNLQKLQQLIQSSNIEKINFIEIAIPTLNEIIQTYGFQMVNRVLVDISKKLSLISGKENILFKLDGNKFGILLRDIDTYESICEKVHTIKIDINNKSEDIKLFMSITSARKNDIINKSSKNLDKAIVNKTKQVVDIY